MAQKQIINYFRKVDKKFLSELNSSQRAEAVEQFQKLWHTQQPKVSIFLNRRQKVNSNRAEQQLQQQHQIKQIASSLRTRMQKHFQKRENLQIQKLKNYKNMDRVWKDKILQIRTQGKKEQKKKLQRYKEISKQIEQFWSKKRNHQRSHSKSLSPKSEIKHSNYFESTHEKKQENKEADGQFRFVTQVRMSRSRTKYKASLRIETQLPAIGDPKKSKLEEASHPKLIKIKSTSTQTFNYHAMKSNDQWKTKQNTHFQNAMEKIDKILNIRLRVRENLKREVKRAKNSRMLKESIIKDKRYFSATQDQHPSPHALRHKTVHKREVQQRKSLASISDRQSKVQLRRQELYNEEFQNRESTFLEQKQKQRRSKFHRMVREAINIYRFQALRQKE